MVPITLRSAKAQPVEAAQGEKTLVLMLDNFRMPPWLDKGGQFFFPDGAGVSPPIQPVRDLKGGDRMTADDSAGSRPIHRRRLLRNALMRGRSGRVHANLLIFPSPVKR